VRARTDERQIKEEKDRQVYSVKSVYKDKEKDQDEIDFSMNWEGEINFGFCDWKYTLKYIIKELAHRLDIKLIKLNYWIIIFQKNIECKSDAKTL